MSKLIHQFTISAALVLLCAAPAAHAELYKWVDAKGKVHYSSSKEEAAGADVKVLDYVSTPVPASSVAEPVPVPDWKLQEEAYKKRQQAALRRERANFEVPVVKKPTAKELAKMKEDACHSCANNIYNRAGGWRNDLDRRS